MYAALYYTTIAISILQNTNRFGGLPVYYSITAIRYTSVLLYSVANNVLVHKISLKITGVMVKEW